MLSEEARVGKRVRAREGARTRPSLSAPTGSIEKRRGHPGHAALDVLLDGGGLRLFLHHEMEAEVDAEDA